MSKVGLSPCLSSELIWLHRHGNRFIGLVPSLPRSYTIRDVCQLVLTLIISVLTRKMDSRYAALSNTLLVSLLVAILSGTYANIAADAVSSYFL